MSTQAELILNRLLTNALSQKATDLYLSVGAVPFIRKEGLIQQMVGEPVVAKPFLEDLIKIIFSPVDQEELRQKGEILTTREFGRNQRFRLLVLQERNVPAFNIKFIPNQIVSLDQLKVKKTIKNLAMLDRGLVIISGPRDSGRTTVVLALLDWIIKNQQKYIATLERPIEYFFLGGKSVVEQREVGRDTPDFLTGIFSLKARNVDVIFISEVGDQEVVLTLLEMAANTLVFTIMNADTVLKVVQRLIDSFSKERQSLVSSYLADTLKCIVCTRLVPRIGGGRVLAMEILNNLPVVQKAIREQRFQQIENILQTGFEDEVLISLDRYLAELVKNGQVLSAEAQKFALDPAGFEALLRE